MPKFMIETTFDVPHYRQTVYEADTFAAALALAAKDDNWDHQIADYECSSEERVTGAWAGEEAYQGIDLTAGDEPRLAALAAVGFEVRHDMHGFYRCTSEEAEHEDKGNSSAGFDGRAHFATVQAACEDYFLSHSGDI